MNYQTVVAAYIQYVETRKNLIRSPRTKDWNLHLHSAVTMMNLFAVKRHYNMQINSNLPPTDV